MCRHSRRRKNLKRHLAVLSRTFSLPLSDGGGRRFYNGNHFRRGTQTHPNVPPKQDRFEIFPSASDLDGTRIP